jgi:WD40 repeat protein
MHEITRILTNLAEGKGDGANDLLPLVYEELRKLASQKLALEKPGQTLQPTTAARKKLTLYANSSKLSAVGLNLPAWLPELKGIWSLTYSPDGRRLASGSLDGTVRDWDAGP